ncbi:hypothetical protein [Verrucosispora sioxanthis]|uniref:Uncharacterized protein n=1 Tax=Verrucosispora sioxanthis TaxID=2499994 RepID=A0A6M1KZI5_9ACTN|nr:hypothetical protein [Verrucosispora sioxanthis]NEE64419.1 hypothetical protein [Verrucosispora sioxanthis]NGM13529.1 hypothetical protein [Verrucosispora sioxanthis]
MSRRYPLPRPTNDARFTFGLVLDVAQVLAEHGNPSMAESYDGCGADLLALQQALFSLIYGTDVPEGHLS